MSSLSDTLDRLRAGKPIILVDDEDRENEGDVVIAAEYADPAAIAFMARNAGGLICLAMEAAAIDRLALQSMAAGNHGQRSTAFTVSIEAREGVTTGISAADRARTIAAAIADVATSWDIVSPGHIFPLRANPMGVLARAGHTEGAVDLMRLAGLKPAGVICEIMNDDGTMARGGDLTAFAHRHDLPILTIAELIVHRLATETLIEPIAVADLPTGAGPFRVHAFRSLVDGGEHLALVVGTPTGAPLVRVHSECLTGDALGSLRCDCGAQLRKAQQLLQKSGNGVLVYLRGHEGRGLGLANKIRAYALQDGGLDTVDANRALGFADDARNYAVAAQILRALGVAHTRLLSNNPRKAADLERYGVAVDAMMPLVPTSNSHAAAYPAAKRDRLGHTLPRDKLALEPVR